MTYDRAKTRATFEHALGFKPIPKTLADITAERSRQDSKWGDQSGNHDATWLAVLSEEVGEVAQAHLHNVYGGKAAGTLRAELVQVAAVAVAWIDALDRRGESKVMVEHG